MQLTRRTWLKLTGGSAALAALDRGHAATAASAVIQPYVREFERSMFDLPGRIKSPVTLVSVELLQRDKDFFVRTRSTDGAEGLVGTKQIEHFIPIFEHLVAPVFVGRDVREIESLVDEVYRANYKLAGIPFWTCVAYIEQSALDLLGKATRQPVGALLGGVIRKEVPVYLSGSDRKLSAEDELAIYIRGVAETGARAVKFKIGGRMSRNLDAYPGRTERLVTLAREKLGDAIELYADANGSYDVRRGIEIGRLLERLRFGFYEEPCPFEELAETQAVARALRLPVAFGEQNFSLWQFDWILREGVAKIVQPDINYHGGLIRTLRVARIADKHGATIVPHNTQTGVTSGNILQFASCTKNLGTFMEYPWRAPQPPPGWYTPDFKIRDGVLRVPATPGMGVAIDPAYVKGARVVATIARAARPAGSAG